MKDESQKNMQYQEDTKREYDHKNEAYHFQINASPHKEQVKPNFNCMVENRDHQIKQ